MTNETMTSSIISFISENLDVGLGNDIIGIFILVLIGSFLLIYTSKISFGYGFIITSFFVLFFGFILNLLELISNTILSLLVVIFVVSLIYYLFE